MPHICPGAGDHLDVHLKLNALVKVDQKSLNKVPSVADLKCLDNSLMKRLEFRCHIWRHKCYLNVLQLAGSVMHLAIVKEKTDSAVGLT